MIVGRLLRVVTYFRSAFSIKREMGIVPIFLFLAGAFLLFAPGNIYAATGNLLLNPGFENPAPLGPDADNWTRSGCAQRENWANHSGTYGMAMADFVAGGTGEAYQEVNAAEGVEYTYTLWTLRDAGVLAGSFYMKLIWFDSGDVEISNDEITITVTTSWVQKTLTRTAPANTAKVRVIFGSVAVSETGKFDDASLTADAYVWDGGGGNSNFTTAANWVGDGAPAADDDVIFNATNNVCILDAFDLDQGDFTVTGGYTGSFTSSGTFKCDVCTLDLSGLTGGGWNISNQFETGTTDHGALSVSAGTFTTSSNLKTSGDLTVSGGTLNALNGTINADSNVVISGGTLTAPSGDFNVAGNFARSGGAFVHSSGTVVFDDSAQTSVVSGSSTFYNLSCTTSNKQINFTVGTTQTVDNILTLTGTSGSLVTLRSTSAGNKWDITLPNGSQTVSFVDVKDADANTNTTTCYASTDSGNNNANWVFKNLSISTPQAAKTVGQQPTIRGSSGAGDTVTIKGTVGAAAYQTVAQVTADANGNYIVRQADYSATLAAGANNIRADVGATLGAPVNVTVVVPTTTNQVPTITSPVDGDKISSAKPALSGSGLAGQNVTVSAWDADGNLLLTDVAATVTAADGTWSIVSSSYTSSLVKGTNYLTVTVAGTASDVVSYSFTDPFGIVFDSTTNEPIANAIVTIYNQNGTLCVPGTDIAGSDLNPQTTGTDGAYSFLCANANFYITVEAPGYTYPSKKTTFSTGRVIVTGSKGEVFTVAGVIIEMDHPMDSNNLLLKIKKEANKKEAVIGDIVTYTVTIKNIGSTDVKNVFLEDRIPGGFKYVSGKAILDNIPVNPKGSTALLFDIGTVNAQTTRTLKYQLIIGSGVTQGNYENRAWARYSDETVISNKDSATVKITLDPLFDLGNLIGKVFWDKNENGYQDNVRCPTSNVGCQKGAKNGVSIREVGSMAERDGTNRENLQNNEEFSKQGIIRHDISTTESGSFSTVEHSGREGLLSQQSIYSVPLSSKGFPVRSNDLAQNSSSTSVSSGWKGEGFTESVQRNSRQNQQSNQLTKKIASDKNRKQGALSSDIGHPASINSESGIAYVRIVMEDGTVVTTDKNGRYHIPAVRPGRHLLRLDESTLPEGAYLTTDKVVVVDITNGLLAKVNFGVNTENKSYPDGHRQDTRHQSQVKIIQKKETAKPRLNVSLYPSQVISHKTQDTRQIADSVERIADRKSKKTKEGKLKADYEFRIFTNYSLFIKRWRIEILDKDTREIVKIFRGDSFNINKPVYWNGELDVRRRTSDAKASSVQHLTSNRNYVYVLIVTGKNGRQDTTKEKKLSVVSYQSSAVSSQLSKTKEEKLKNKWLKKEAAGNSLKKQTIKVEGDTLLIKNTEIFETKVINYSGDKNPVDVIYVDGKKIDADSITQNQNSEYELIIPEGEHKVFVSGTDAAGKQVTTTKKLSVNDSYLFFIAMGDAKAGYTFHSGSIEPIRHDDKYQEGFWSEGKLAYYLKGKILGKFLITSSLDTDRKQKELFRNLDPDKYYPIYGDTSTIDYQATQTQGALYLLVEWDKSSFTWGNYVIDFTDTDIASFKRSLYGAKLDYESVSKTKFGQPLTHLIAFKARAQQQAAHVEFLGTGGSLFYLKHKRVIEGSEKITIEVRDKISGLVLAAMEQDEGFDYEIDYDNGRIIFWQPISHITESDTIISNYLLNGNPVYVTVDYEYETKDKYDRGIYGGRVEQALGDYLSVGGTYVKEEQVDNNYQLAGTDASLRLGDKTTITAEYAESRSKELSSYISTDGGLSFSELLSDEAARGRAYGLSLSSYIIKDLGLEAYYKKVEDNFSSISTAQEQGKELTGGKLTYNLTDNTHIALRHDTQELIDGGNAQSSLQVGANKTQTTSAQITHKLEKLKFTGEYRHQKAEGVIAAYESESNADIDLLALKADYKLTEDVILSLGQQTTLKGETNNQTTAGIQTKINENLTLRAKQALGTKGAATNLGASYNITDKLEVLGDYAIGRFGSSSTDNSFSLTTRAKGDEGDEIYHTYTVSHDELEGKKYSQVTGTKRKFENGMEFKMEEEKSLLEGEKTNTNILGLSGDINDKAAGFVQFERGEVQNLDGTQTKRNAISLGGSYVDNDWFKASSKLELRVDKSRENARQYLSYNALELKPNENTTLFAKANLSQSDNTTADTRQGLYQEFSLAAAYRPVTCDKLNFFSKYTYLRNDSPSSQDDYENIEEEKAHVIAAEGAYDLSRKWQLVEKVALKMTDERVTGFDFTESQTFLSVNRLNYFVDNNWKIGAEYRFLKQKQAKDYKQGALLEISRQIGPYAELGLGYNFTDFNDDLTHLDYTSHGPFIRVTGKFYDRSEREKDKSKEKQLRKDIDKWAFERAEKNDILIKELNSQLKKAKQLQKDGYLKEARLLYAQVYNQARALYIQEKDYVKEKVCFERELKEQDELAHKYCREGRLEDARKLWQNIINEIQRSGEK